MCMYYTSEGIRASMCIPNIVFTIMNGLTDTAFFDKYDWLHILLILHLWYVKATRDQFSGQDVRIFVILKLFWKTLFMLMEMSV